MQDCVQYSARVVNSNSFVGLVVMTLASHARGPQFNPGTKYFRLGQFSMKEKMTRTVRTPGIEPGAQAWEACMLPLHYERSRVTSGFVIINELNNFSSYE